jgi:hypothetical protein
MIDGREYGMEQFVMQLEKIGVMGIQITVASEARIRMANSLVDEIKSQLLRAFESLPKGRDYLRAYDLLDIALNMMRDKYERADYEFPSPRHIDTRQIPLFKRVGNLRELEAMTA